MQIFAICCLVVIVITIQHLLNWGWRKAWNSKEEVAAVVMFILSCIALLVSYGCLYNIIIWTYPLLNK